VGVELDMDSPFLDRLSVSISIPNPRWWSADVVHNAELPLFGGLRTYKRLGRGQCSFDVWWCSYMAGPRWESGIGGIMEAWKAGDHYNTTTVVSDFPILRLFYVKHVLTC
jgi:hypothetical protein